MALFTLLVIAHLCLIFKSTRLVGVVGLTLLFLIYPFVFLSFLVVSCLSVYFKFKFNRSKNYVQPKLPS